MRTATAIFRVLFVVPVARLMLRVMAWRLLVARMQPFQVRDRELAKAAKLVGRCQACGAAGTLEADHYRPRWAGGAEHAGNIAALCLACHTVKTKAESRVRARVRLMRHRGGHGRLRADAVPGHRWLLVGLVSLGLVDGAFGVLPVLWRVGIIAALVVGIIMQRRRRGRISGQDEMIASDRDDERKRYALTLAGDHILVAQAIKVAKLKTRATLIWLPSAYLVGLVLAFLAF